MAVSGLLSSVLANDIICLAFAPVLARACLAAGISPLPHLLGLAMAANVGSAATLIGNPQNMLIGQLGDLEFSAYLAFSLVPTLLALAGAWLVLRLLHHRALVTAPEPMPYPLAPDAAVDPPFDAWQTGKGLALLALLVGLFLTDLPRDKVALSLAALLLLSRRMRTRSILGLVDWHLLTFFAALFVVVGLFRETGAKGIRRMEINRRLGNPSQFVNASCMIKMAVGDKNISYNQIHLGNLIDNVEYISARIDHQTLFCLFAA